MTEQPWIGIDVSKATLDVACLPDETMWTAANDPLGWGQLCQQLRTMAPAGIVMEATGSSHVGVLVRTSCGPKHFDSVTVPTQRRIEQMPGCWQSMASQSDQRPRRCQPTIRPDYSH